MILSSESDEGEAVGVLFFTVIGVATGSFLAKNELKKGEAMDARAREGVIAHTQWTVDWFSLARSFWVA